MHRNLDRRIEVLVRLTGSRHVRSLSELMDLAFDPGTASWHLGADGEWVRVNQGHDGQPLRDIQSLLIARQTRRLGSVS
jgi:polyphosphate kinase